MTILLIILLVCAAICFALATVGVSSRFNLTAAGLFFWVVTQLLPALIKMGCIVLAVMLLTGCAGSGEGGKWTPQDTAAATDAINGGVNALNNGYRTYDQIRNPQYYRPVVPVTPVVPIVR